MGWSNYGARFYDPAIARFTTIDPLTEEFPWQSGYVYADNDPVGKIDFMGMSGESHHVDENGVAIHTYDDGDDSVYEHENGTTKEDIDIQREGGKYTGGDGNYIAEMKDYLDPSTLNKNILKSNYPGGKNPSTFPDENGNVKDDYTAPPVDNAGYPAIIHDLEYGKVGAAGPAGLFTDSNTSMADLRFVKNEFTVAKLAKLQGDYKLAIKSYALRVGLGICALPKTLIKGVTMQGRLEMQIIGEISKLD